MSKIKQYDKGFSPPSLQRKYSLTYVQGVELADYIQGLKELLKECRNWLKSYRDTHNSIKDDVNETINKIDEVLK